jgi:hypothetical protein
VTFTVHYRLVDGDVVIEADTGSRIVSLSGESVAAFYASFCRAAGELGIRRPGSPLLCEIPNARRVSKKITLSATGIATRLGLSGRR